MTVSAEDLCNRALALLGDKPISSLDDTDDRSATCALLYEVARDAALIEHPWNGCVFRQALALNAATVAQTLTLSSASPGSSITATAGGGSVFASTDVDDLIIDPAGDGRAVITAYVSPTVVTVTVLVAFASASYASGLWAISRVPAFEYGYAFALPTTPVCLRILDSSEAPTAWQAESLDDGTKVLVTDASALSIRFIGRPDDPDDFPFLVQEAIVYRLAEKLAFPITGNREFAATMYDLAQKKLRELKAQDAQEGSPRTLQTRALLDVR